MEIRKMTIRDYEDVHKLWVKCNLPVNESDSKGAIEIYLERNPDTCLVGIKNGKIISTVLGGFDGRRGIINHLAVEENFRGRGYGFRIMKVLQEIYENKGVLKGHLWLKTNNLEVINFYEKLGYKLREDIVTVTKLYKGD